MKKAFLSIAVPCLVMCALVFLDANYTALSVPDVLTMLCAVITAVSIGLYWRKIKGA